MSAVADRNLLFGILALQMDFISRDQLVEAMNAWVLAKERPLGDILAERGALATADRALLTPMVERHIAKHGGDAARSLAALSSPPPVKQALAAVADEEVHASLVHLPQTRQLPEEAPPTTVGSEPPPDLGIRYLIERPHARGGLGEVFVARDKELNRKVALKHIQEKHADDPASRSLFLLEGEITGGLEHPGIIPIYGLGQYADGRPFYAMRFVEGDSLLRAIERFHRPAAPLTAGERNVAFRALLGRFLDVCNAVAYAHRRGVLHRDLKPGNVMLGEFGETLVIDWGMAKVLKAAAEQTTSENSPAVEPLTPTHEALATVGRGIHGTPGYMSPEQAGGRIDELGPATDIYSLGAILFHILAGRPPLTRDDGDVLGRTLRGDLPSVRQLKPGVSRPLEAICRKALTLHPRERYPSVQALAADVKQWLADEPVSAWREPLAVRGRRWLRKHPRLVAGAAAALLVGLLGTLGGSALLDAKNRDLERALADAKAARRRADDRTRLADERFTLAVDAFKQQVVDADKLLVNRSGTGELRKAIMAHAEAGLKKLVREAEQTQGAEHVRVWAHVALGDVYLQSDGNVSRARHEYQLAFQLSNHLAAADPNDAQAQRDLAVSFNKVGDVLFQQGDTTKALEQYRESLKLRQRLVAASPKDARAQRDLSLCFDNIGYVLHQQGEVQKALQQFRKGLTIGQRLAAADPSDTRAQRDLSVGFDNIGDLLLQQGDVQQALEQYRESLKVRQRLAAADPNDARAQRDLSLSFNKLGDVLFRQGEATKALEQYRESLKLRQRLAAADPQDAQIQRKLLYSLNRIGDVLLRLGEGAKALQQYRDSLKIAQRLATTDPQNAQAQRDLSLCFDNIGNVLLQQGNVQEALQQYREGLKIAQRLAADPKDAQAQRDLSVGFDNIGNVLLRQGNVQEALEQYRESLKLRQRLAAADPKDARAQRDLFISFNKVGDVLLRQRDMQQALKQYRAGLKIAQRLAAADPRNFEAQTDLVVSHVTDNSMAKDNFQPWRCVE